MVLSFDPFREFDRLAGQMFGAAGAADAPLAMPMDLYRLGDHFVMNVDLAGVDPGSIDVSVDGSVLTVRAERSARTEGDATWLRRERPTGTFERRLTLGDNLDLDRISATWHDGVLTLTIPVAEHARPRRITVNAGSGRVIEGTSTETTALGSAAG